MSATATRRDFLKTTAIGCSTAGLFDWWGTQVSQAANFNSSVEQPVVGFIGTGIRFHSALGREATEYGPCAAICDVDAVQAGRAQQVVREQHQKHGHPLYVPVYEDYRRVLDHPDINAVVIATPDHWHTKIAVEAMQAGKDVYCEKPLTLTIREGQQIIETIEKTKRVLQVGTQQRTEFDKMFANAAALVREGRIGKVKHVTCAIGGSMVSPPLKAVAPPKSLNWNQWLGQAPHAEYRVGEIIHAEGWGAGFPLSRTHRYFRWWYEYSGGKMTDWGAHHIDIALWAMDKERADVGNITIDPLMVEHPVPFKNGMPTAADRFNAATKFKLRVTFADGIEMDIRHDAKDLGFDNGIMFQGSNGRFLVNRARLVGKPVEDLAKNPLPGDALEKLYGGKVPTGQMANFMECLKTRETPVSDAVSHHRMLAIGHAANIAMRLGRKLVYDPARDQFVGDAEASTFIEREQRKGFEIRV